ncbi:hypothetical protein Tco_1577240, partial [Tanacetum coccineum]
MVNMSLKKLKHHLAGFDVIIKERTTTTTITKGSWGFEHTKACFRDEIIPFVKALKDLFNTFDQYLIDELSEVQNVFHQMKQAVEQHRLESKTFQVKMNQVLNENERLLEQVINKDIVNIIMNLTVDNASVNVHECEKCLKLETGILNKKYFIEKETYDKLFRSFTTLEKHCISLEVDINLIRKEKHLVITALKNELRKLKGNDLADNVLTKHPIALEMLKIDVKPIAPRLLNNRTAHSDYRPTGRTFTIVGNVCPITRITTTAEVPLRKPTALESDTPKPGVPLVYLRKPRKSKTNVPVVQIVLWSLDSVKLGNDHVAKILGYGDYQIGNVTISRVYYVEGLEHNLFSIGQFYFDELTAMASEHSSLGPALYEMTPATISSALVPNPPPLTYVDRPTPEVLALIAEVVAPEPAVSTSSSSSTTIDQDAPSHSNSQTTPKTQSLIISNDVEEDNHELDVAHMNNDPLFGIPIPKNYYEASSSSDVIPTIVHTATPHSEHITKWTNDHPLENIIGELERPVSTRLQLHEQALFCYYNAFLTSVEPKNYKDALTQ